MNNSIFDLNVTDKKEVGTEMPVLLPNGKPYVLKEFEGEEATENEPATPDKPFSLLVNGNGSAKAIKASAFLSTQLNTLEKKVLKKSVKLSEQNRLNADAACMFVSGWVNSDVEFSKANLKKFIQGYPDITSQIQMHAGDSNNYLK